MAKRCRLLPKLKQHFVFQVEHLETRMAPSTFTWTGAAGLLKPSWGDPANWKRTWQSPGNNDTFPGQTFAGQGKGDIASFYDAFTTGGFVAVIDVTTQGDNALKLDRLLLMQTSARVVLDKKVKVFEIFIQQAGALVERGRQDNDGNIEFDAQDLEIVGGNKNEWDGGIQEGGGSTIIDNGATLTIGADEGGEEGPALTFHRTMENYGTVNWIDRDLQIGQESAFNNYNMFTASLAFGRMTPFGVKSGQFVNLKTYINEGCCGSSIEIPFSSLTGSNVKVTQGNMILAGGGKSNGATYDISAGSQLIFRQPKDKRVLDLLKTLMGTTTYTYLWDTTKFTGKGKMKNEGAKVEIRNRNDANNFIFQNGSLIVEAVPNRLDMLTIYQTLNWVFGSMVGGGVITLLGASGTIGGGPLELLDRWAFTSQYSNIIVQGAMFEFRHGSMFYNINSTFNIVDGSSIPGDAQSGFDNNVGKVVKSGGGEAKVGVSFINGMGGSGSSSLGVAQLIASGGIINFTRSLKMVSGGSAQLVGGTIEDSGGPFVISGGALLGTGTFEGTIVNNAGLIEPGGIGGIGTITIAAVAGSKLLTGDYLTPVNGSGGIVAEIASATSFDKLVIAGNAQFNPNQFGVSFLGTFQPVNGSFEVIDYRSHSGDFVGLASSPRWTVNNVVYDFLPTYTTSTDPSGDKNLTLTVVAVPNLPAPTISSITPSSGTTAGGTILTVRGQYFTGTADVMIASIPVAKFILNSDSTITVVTGPHAAGTNLTMQVTTSHGYGGSSAFTYTAAAVPGVSGVTPSSDPTDGTNIVTITGSGFTGASSVSFGGPTAFFKVISDSLIVAQAPTSNAVGTYDVTVTTPSGTSATGSADHFTYTTPPVPGVSSISPATGSTAGGTVVTITGTGFTNAYDVSFGGYPATFTTNSDTSITAIAPAQATGAVDVTVTRSSGTSALVTADRFTYTAAAAPNVTSISPNSGSTGGGTQVVITGSGFTGTSAVNFGSVPAASFTINSDTSITATAPTQAAGTYDIIVTTPSGTSATSTSDRFTFNAAGVPTVTAVNPSTGTSAGGALVTITGTNFTGASAVNFGSTTASSFTVVSDTVITATAPPEAAATYDITVTTPSGTSATGSADHYTVTAAAVPSVSSILPTSGSAAGGTVVTITGGAFTGASAVNFGTVAATSFTVISDTSITAVAPGQSAGTYDITVVTPSGTSATGSVDRFTYTAVPVPIVTSISPNSGSTAGGTSVTIMGSGFTTASAVNFGPAAAASFTINSDTLITAVTPPNAAGTWDMSVVNAAGTSALGTTDRFTFTAASAPAVTSVSPNSGTSAGGAAVTITGTNFTGASGVNFGTVSASFSVISDTTIIATAPPQAAATVDIIVTTPTGTSAVGTADHFTYSAAAAPSVTAVSPNTGSSAGGTRVTITGSAFTGASAVNFGSVAAAAFLVINDTTIIATSPPQAAGTVDITVTTPSGTSATGTADHYTVTAAAAPVVSGITPTSGTQAGGTVVVIWGSGFTGASAVNFGSTPAASFTVNSDTSITATAPYGTSATQVDVTVTTPSGTSATGSADKFTYNYVTTSAPAVTGVAPNTGTTSGGTVLTITGTNFTGATAVKFGTTNATSFTVNTDGQITATAPSGSAGTVDIKVTTPSGTSSVVTADQFTYVSASVPTVTGISPSTGTTAGGTSVTITGTNFTGATAVSFGGVAASSFTVNSSTSITATSPPEATGIVDITVTTQAGTSATSSSDRFTYTAASVPTLTSISPTSGSTAGGTSVTLTGTNFTGAIGVYFGNVAAASFTINSSTQITVTSPAQSAGTYDITVVTFSGTSVLSSSDRFTYTAASAPAVTSISPTTGSTAGGTSITITGTSFTGATSVFFGTVAAASFTVNSSTSITAVSPSQAAATVDVTVGTFTGTSAVLSADQFTYTNAAVPTVTAVSPSSGSTGGGTSVTITGTAFAGATVVNFGSVAATSFTVNSDTSITATAPPQAAGTVDITVTTPSGTSATGTVDHYTYNAAAVPAITNVMPSSGNLAGGTAVTVIGSGFTGASAVNFGSSAATSYTIVSDTAILATSPSGTAGTVDITVTTPSGTSTTGAADHFTYTSAVPAITSISPTSGTTGGGTVVTITGSGFTNASEVIFGDTDAANFTVISDTTIQAVSPAHPAGTWDISVLGPGGTSALGSGDRWTFNAAAAPAVTSISPSSGSTAGGTAVIITGSGFTGATGVFFGEAFPANSYVVNSDTSITAISPAEAAGTVDITVNTYSGASAVVTADQFTFTAAAAPSVTGVTPTTGPNGGGTSVTVSGSGFTGATSVTFGSTAASSFTVVNDSTIIATAPSQAAATKDITVTTPSGTSSTSSSDQFTYSAAAVASVTGVNPNSGSTAGGTVVTITGSGFTAATGVNFGTNASVTFKVNSDTSITATAPGGSAGTVDITVVNLSGTSSTSTSDQFTYTSVSAPTVTAVSPNSGSTAGGTVVTVTGTNFTGATTVTFGGVPATSFFVVSSTSMTAVAPSEAAGTVDIVVTTAGGSSATSSSDRFTYSAAAVPTVTAVSPNSGSTSGGTGVNITGTGFKGATAVKFGSVVATSFTVISDTSITAVAPPQAAATVDITLTTPTGTSSTGTADHFTYNAAPVPTVTAVTPNTGTTAGTTIVVITGTNFMGATAVNFGSVAATSFTINSNTQITATAPPQAAGTIDVKVTTNAGTSATGSADHFTYNAASVPAVTSVTPTSIYTTGGAPETIIGSAFTGTTAVKFGTTAATSFTIYNDQTIVAVAPVHSSGTVDITVTTFSGTSSTGTADQVSYVIPPPSVTGLSPSSGQSGGGNQVIISGTAFTGVTSVYFGGNSATIRSNTDTSITVTAPAGTLGTTVDVTVTTPYGTSAIVYADQYTYTQGSSPSGGASPSFLRSASIGGASLSLAANNSQNGTAKIAPALAGQPLSTLIITGDELVFSGRNGFWNQSPAELSKEIHGAEGKWLHRGLGLDLLPLVTRSSRLTHSEGINVQHRALAHRWQDAVEIEAVTSETENFLWEHLPGQVSADWWERRMVNSRK